MGGRRMPGIAYGHVKLVSGYESLLRILKLPPELVTDRCDLRRARRETRILNRMDNPRRRQEKHHHDENRDHGPSQLHLVAAVDLRWLVSVIRGTAPVFYDRICQQAENDNKDA